MKQPENIRASKRKWQAKWVKTPEGAKYQREYLKKYRANPANKQIKREYQREWSPAWNKTPKGLANQQRKNHNPKGRFRGFKHNAKTRDLPFELTFEQFVKFWQKPCHYCGDAIAEIGLDRVDNTKGYVAGNVVPCCKKCNWMKRNLELNEFYEHIRKIAKRIK